MHLHKLPFTQSAKSLDYFRIQLESKRQCKTLRLGQRFFEVYFRVVRIPSEAVKIDKQSPRDVTSHCPRESLTYTHGFGTRNTSSGAHNSPRVHARLRMGAVVRRTGAGHRLRGLDFRFVLCYNYGHAVNCHFPGLRGAAVYVFEPRRMTSLLQRAFVFLLALLVAGGRQELTGDLLGDQLRVDTRLASRGTLPNVTHQAFESFSRVSVCAHTAIPEIILDHFGLTLSPAYRAPLMIHCERKH